VVRFWEGRGLRGLRLGWTPPERVVRYAAMYQPARVGERNQKLLAYVLALRRLKVEWLPHKLRVAFKVWWRDARAVVGTKAEITSFKHLHDAWDRCPRQDPGIDVRRLRRQSAGVELPAEAAGYSGRDRRLLRACISLQRLHGEDPFYISYEDAGRLLGVAKPTARLALRRLVKAGALERVSVGNNLTGRASAYRCPVEAPDP
jgi:hypothetical protein